MPRWPKLQLVASPNSTSANATNFILDAKHLTPPSNAPVLHVTAVGLKNTSRFLSCRPHQIICFCSRAFQHSSDTPDCTLVHPTSSVIPPMLFTGSDISIWTGLGEGGGGDAMAGVRYGTSTLRWGISEEKFPAEPGRVRRGVNGEADGTRVVENLVVISSLRRRETMKRCRGQL